MALTTDVKTGKRPIPHEPEQWMEFRMLSWLTLEKSEKLRSVELTAEVALMSKETVAAAKEQLAIAGNGAIKIDPLIRHDKLTLLKHGIVAWSYGDEILPEELDAKTAVWAAREILEFSDPTADDIKKGLSRAIAS